MPGRWYALAVAVTLAAAACSERDTESTTGPQFAGGSNTGPCDISNSLVTGYFPSSNQSFILSLKSSMANAGHGTDNARTFGFQIMDSIGSVSRNYSSVSASAGAQLTIALIGCMFDETFNYPLEGATQAFTYALTKATGGAYYVRGGGANGADATGRSLPILGRISPPGGADGNLSGVEPSSGSTWTNMLSINPTQMHTKQGVLFYGYPVPNQPSLVYEWTTIPSGLTLSPAGLFSICDFNSTSSGSTMIVEGGAGVLSFVNSSICSTPQQPLTFLDQGWGPKALAGRLVRAFAGAMTPTPLQAAVVTGTRTGGSTAPKSRFKQESVTSDAVSMTWTPGGDPGIPSTWNGTSAASARPTSAFVSVNLSSGPQPAVLWCAYLSGNNNNGTPTKLLKASGDSRVPQCTSPPNGDPNALSVLTQPENTTQSKADFGGVYVTKTGTITVTMTLVSGAAANASLSTTAYVKPLSKK
jgi:hypothetical protein